MLLKIILGIHIAAGALALIAGLISILSKKGQKLHLRAGKIFFYSMLVIAVSAIIIASIKKNNFLLLIALFAFYQNYSGYRATKNKKLRPSLMDWTVVGIAAINSVVMISTMNIILIVFGSINAYLVIGDLRIFIKTVRNKEIPQNQWLVRHIGMMLGSYIATTTAFVVVNIRNFNPSWLPWLLPTFIGVPLILYWTRKYKMQKVKLPVQVLP